MPPSEPRDRSKCSQRQSQREEVVYRTQPKGPNDEKNATEPTASLKRKRNHNHGKRREPMNSNWTLKYPNMIVARIERGPTTSMGVRTEHNNLHRTDVVPSSNGLAPAGVPAAK